MAEESLQDLAARLRAELAEAKSLDPQTRDALHRLSQDVEAAMHKQGLADRVRDAIRELEVSHPRIANTLGSIMDTLAFYNL